MEDFKLIYCVGCEKHTEFVSKLSAVMSGKRVCDVCRRMNGVYTLTKPDNPMFTKTSEDIKWIIYDESGKYKDTLDNIEKGCSLLMSPFNDGYTWLTTIVNEIVESNESFILFETENSIYKLYKPIK